MCVVWTGADEEMERLTMHSIAESLSLDHVSLFVMC